MAAVNGTLNLPNMLINGDDEESQLIPLYNPIQVAINQLENLNQVYRERAIRLNERRRYTFPYHWDTIVSSSCGAIALIVASIYVPLKLKALLNCDKPSGSCIATSGPYDKNCVIDYHWCKSMYYIGNTLWNYVNQNTAPTYNWADAIIDYCMDTPVVGSNGGLDTFIFGLTVVCNSTAGEMISIPLTIDFPTEIVVNAFFYTFVAHTVGQLFTWGIEMCAIELPLLSVSEYYQLYKNRATLLEAQDNYQNALLTRAHSDEPLPILPNVEMMVESQRIFNEQSRRYIRDITKYSLYPIAFMIFYGGWMTTLYYVNEMFKNYTNDPSASINYPYPCQENTYEAAYYSGWVRGDQTVIMPGGLQYLFSLGAPPSNSMEAHAINILAVGFFTALIAPIFALLSDLSFKYIPYCKDIFRNRNHLN